MEGLLTGSVFILIVAVMVIVLLLALGIIIVWLNNKMKKQFIANQTRQPRRSEKQHSKKCTSCKDCQCQKDD